MLALRLARGSRPLVQLRRLLVAAASAGTGLLLLCVLAYAMERPEPSEGATLRLAWCLVPLAATVYLAVAVARTDPATRPRPGLSAVGLGPVRLTAIAALSTAVACTFGSLVALMLFLHLRGDLTGLPFDGAAAGMLAADVPLPSAAALTLLSVAPIAASGASAFALRPRRVKRGSADPADPDRPEAPATSPNGLPWGVALLAAGLAVETYASPVGQARGLPLPGGLAGESFGVLAGWALTAVGLALAGPGLTFQCGRALQTVRPGALRLLAGRVLQQEARRIGRPLGVLCAVVSGAYAGATVSASSTGVPTGSGSGPLSALGVLLVAGCAFVALMMAALEARQRREPTTQALLRFGAPTAVLRGAALLRAGALLTLFVPLTWMIAELAATPLSR
ncbi:hypothetical protein ACWCP6_37030 [Streptomyces sp. NPDC002004]